MGNNNSNPCELQEYGNVCKMTNCLSNNLVGLESNSASSTDTWIAKFNKGVTYNGKEINEAFLKIWISNSTFDRINNNILKINDYNYVISDFIENNLSLNYEARVYRDIIKPLIEINICPNFIKFLGLGENCSFENTASLLKTRHLLENRNINGTTKRNGYWNLYGTTIALITGNVRNKITSNYNIKTLQEIQKVITLNNVIDKFTYNILVNEVITPGTQILSDFIYNKGLVKQQKPNFEVWTVIFQALAACYAMSCSKMVHNDLHLGNIYVEPIKKTRFNYIYDNTLFTFETNYIVKVFDFDRSFVKRFGNNPYLSAQFCDMSSQCNRYIENIDALKILNGVYRMVNKSEKQNIINICSNGTQNSKQLLKKIFSGSMLTYNNKALDTYKFNRFNSTIEIMKNISKHCDIENIYPNNYKPELQNTFVCNKNMFDNQGKIIQTNIAEIVINNDIVQKLNNEIKILKSKLDVITKENEKLKNNYKLSTSVKKKKVVIYKQKNDCLPGQVRDKITKRCRKRKKPGPKKK